METGHAINVAQFKKLQIAVTGYGTEYVPSNNKIKLTAIATKATSSESALENVATQKSPYDTAVIDRKAGYLPLNDLALGAFLSLKSSENVEPASVKHAETLLRKINGNNKYTPKAPENQTPVNPGIPPSGSTTPEPEPTPKSHSKSQQSFVKRAANFQELIALITGDSHYATNEPDYQITSLQDFADKLDDLNEAVATTYIPYSDALSARDTELYFPVTGIYDLADTVKTYVKSIKTLNQTAKNLVVKLKFTKPSKDSIHL